jgi:hypothetical protein
MDCDKPLLVVCGNGCGASDVWRCNNHRASKCKPCSTRYRLQVKRIAAEGMLSRCTSGHLGMLTVTAPSTNGEHLGWVVDWDKKSPRPVCGCARHMVEGLAAWNASAASRWNRLRGELVRLYPGMVYFRAVEPQDGKHRLDGIGRGALHFHILIWTPIPLVLKEVQALAMAAGFGCVLDYEESNPGDTRHAHYASKYATKATDRRCEVPWERLDRKTGELITATEATFRTWSCSRQWGLTMKAIRNGIKEAAQRRAAILRESLTLATELGESAGIGCPVVAGLSPP